MIKLQLLLRRPSPDIALDPAVRVVLEAHGLVVTGSGRASVTAQMSEAAFERLFGVPPAPDLPLPPGLADAISLITIAPRHSAMRHNPRVKHAAI
ncbi:MAG: hypothetical protein WKG03_22640 [Telluria sp.]